MNIFPSSNAGWETKPCRQCGRPARYPAELIQSFAGLKNVLQKIEEAGILCDACELASRRDSTEASGKRNIDRTIERSGIPPAPPVRLHPGFEAFIHSPRSGLFVYGVPGTYKTSQGVQLIREWCQRGRPAVYARERDYFRACWDKDRDYIDRLKRTPLLVLDDLGTDHQSSWSAGLFYDLVDARYSHQLKTVWISNHSLGELAGMPDEHGRPRSGFHHFDDRVFRRISEMCEEPILTMGGVR